MVVGTVPLDSRQIQFTYHVMSMATVGTTGAPGLCITLKGQSDDGCLVKITG